MEGDDVTLTCQATRYLYTSLQWLDSRNQTITVNVSDVQIGPYSISLSLHLQNVSQNGTTGYKCRANKLNKWSKLKTVLLTVNGMLAGAPAEEILFFTLFFFFLLIY